MTSRSTLTRQSSLRSMSDRYGRHPEPLPEPLFSSEELGLDTPSRGKVISEADRCDRCHRPLTTEAARKSRLGTTCAAKIGRAVHVNEVRAAAERLAHALAA